MKVASILASSCGWQRGAAGPAPPLVSRKRGWVKLLLLRFLANEKGSVEEAEGEVEAPLLGVLVEAVEVREGTKKGRKK